MAYDTGIAQLLRSDLADLPIVEKRMFGGLVFMWRGHMLCGVHGRGAMFRIGAPNAAAALALPGVTPMAFTGKPMAGFVDCSDETMVNDSHRAALMALAMGFVKTLPPK